MESNIELVIHPKEKHISEEFIVKRSLPFAKKRMVGPFIFWDHMGPALINEKNEMLVRSHPHIGLSTITYLFSGKILHRDSLGNEVFIKPGEVNWMTAGKGITHSERSSVEYFQGTIEGIQLWVALPEEKEDIEPNFHHFEESELPKLNQGNTTLILVAGKALGEESPVPVYSDLFYLAAANDESSTFQMDLEQNQEAAVYLAEGSISIEGERYENNALIVFKQGSKVEYTADAKTKVLIFGGEKFPKDHHIYWNFVSSSKEKIEQAKQDWKDDKFPPVPKETDRIPLPE